MKNWARPSTIPLKKAMQTQVHTYIYAVDVETCKGNVEPDIFKVIYDLLTDNLSILLVKI